MIKDSYNVIGVMSGTSLDGVDLAHIQFTNNNGNWLFTIRDAETIPYSTAWVNKLKAAVHFTHNELNQLDEEYTLLLANTINSFIKKHRLMGLDAVCSHGHTVLHQPQNGITLQIGNLPKISVITGVRMVCNFRVQDVALGGQGAPLVPTGDRLLFYSYTYCINLGGFSNISFDENGQRTAFDICPVNTVLNYYANKLGHDYDDKGSIAATGTILQPLLDELNALEYYRLDYPKSLGIEFVEAVIQPLLQKYNVAPKDVLATFTHHAAVQIAAVLNKYSNTGATALVTGGGAYNTTLINKIKQMAPSVIVTIPNDKILQYKEALIFALLGVLKLRNEVNVLSSVTGAAHNHSSGHVFEPTVSPFF